MKPSLRITIPLALAISALLAIVGGYSLEKSRIEDMAIEQLQDDLRRILSLEQGIIERAGRMGYPELVSVTVAELGVDRRLERAFLIDERDLVLASLRQEHQGLAFPGLCREAPSDTCSQLMASLKHVRRTREGWVGRCHGGDRLCGLYPVILGGDLNALRPNRVGAIYVELDLPTAMAAEYRMLGDLIRALGGLIVLISLILALFLHFRVSQRLYRLSAIIHRISQQGFSGQTDLASNFNTDGHDEISDLSRALVEMVDRRQHLEDERSRLIGAFEQAVDPAFVTGLDGRILLINPAFTEIYEFENEEVIGHLPRLLSSGEHDNDFYEEIWTTIQSGHPWTGRIINRTKSGSRLHFDMTISPVRGPDGNMREYFVTQRNVTHEVGLQSQLSQAHKLEAVGRLAGGVAHDFNNLLTVILGSLELAQQESRSPHLKMIGEAAERASALTGQLLQFSRQSTPEPQLIDVESALGESTRLLNRLLGEDIHLEVPPAEHPCQICFDPTQFQQIVLNLAINARDAMPKGGSLSLEIELIDRHANDLAPIPPSTLKPGQYCMLRVQDTGIGIHEDHLARIFDPFFTTKKKGQGTGLGLATTYGIVKQSGGDIDVQSHPGQGTTFRVFLPLAEAMPTLRSAQDPADETRGEDGKTVLLVEDEPELRHVIATILRQNHFQVIEAKDAEEALGSNLENGENAHWPQLLITDLVLPGMNGQSLAQHLLREHPSMRVLLMSGYTSESLIARGIIDPSEDLLIKPFSPSTLMEKVWQTLN